MSSKKDFVEYICSQLSSLGEVSYRPMMGEYIIYVNGKYCIGICDDQVFLKHTKEVKPLLKEVLEQAMYHGAKPSYLITDFDDKEYLCHIVQVTCQYLPVGKKKKSCEN